MFLQFSRSDLPELLLLSVIGCLCFRLLTFLFFVAQVRQGAFQRCVWFHNTRPSEVKIVLPPGSLYDLTEGCDDMGSVELDIGDVKEAILHPVAPIGTSNGTTGLDAVQPAVYFATDGIPVWNGNHNMIYKNGKRRETNLASWWTAFFALEIVACTFVPVWLFSACLSTCNGKLKNSSSKWRTIWIGKAITMLAVGLIVFGLQLAAIVCLALNYTSTDISNPLVPAQLQLLGPVFLGNAYPIFTLQYSLVLLTSVTIGGQFSWCLFFLIFFFFFPPFL